MKKELDATSVMSARAPQRIYVKSGEDYRTARRRWLVRWAEYRDALVMAEIEFQRQRGATPKQLRFMRAFWGVELKYVLPVMDDAA